jgi:hypothetical protein
LDHGDSTVDQNIGLEDLDAVEKAMEISLPRLYAPPHDINIIEALPEIAVKFTERFRHKGADQVASAPQRPPQD